MRKFGTFFIISEKYTETQIATEHMREDRKAATTLIKHMSGMSEEEKKMLLTLLAGYSAGITAASKSA